MNPRGWFNVLRESEKIQIVWLKRDLRIEDHAPLAAASRTGIPTAVLYIWESEWMEAPDFDLMHAKFIRESLNELRRNLKNLGVELIECVGEAVQIFQCWTSKFSVETIFSHEETGNARTYQRDLRMEQWTRQARIRWIQFRQTGVVRRLKNRDGWSRQWEIFMRQKPTIVKPGFIQTSLPHGLPILVNRLPHFQFHSENRAGDIPIGGTSVGRANLNSFLSGRGKNYSREMSSPLTAFQSCSRISPYLTWGCLSTREVVQTVKTASSSKSHSIPSTSISSFTKRLHWRCHFIQKLESEPLIEFRNFNPLTENLRIADDQTLTYLDSWQSGTTGYPFVDACMRALKAEGWINFRMRAMLVSFAAFDLWLDWRLFKDFLARQFIDYEPGIHYSQLQMQSGVTGINTLRIYNPVKQGMDQDPEGIFIKKWIPELKSLPASWIHEPWKRSKSELARHGVHLGSIAKGGSEINYPAPIVNHSTAVQQAKVRFSELRKDPMWKESVARVYDRHGSRKGSERSQVERNHRKIRINGKDAPMGSLSVRQRQNPAQLELNL